MRLQAFVAGHSLPESVPVARLHAILRRQLIRRQALMLGACEDEERQIIADVDALLGVLGVLRLPDDACDCRDGSGRSHGTSQLPVG